MVSVDRCVCVMCVCVGLDGGACLLALWPRGREAVRDGYGWMVALLQ